jgi:RimJ/RimL family protein N-acetyltransferase
VRPDLGPPGVTAPAVTLPNVTLPSVTLPRVTLRAMPLADVALLLLGRRPTQGWHPQYPLTDTLVAVQMLTEAHRAAGWSGARVPQWWVQQIVVDHQVVGDAGFHGPPATDGDIEVEIGYAVVPAMRRRGIAGRACRLLVDQAWRDGAQRVFADAEFDNVASQRVLLGAGFAARDDRGPNNGYVLRRPGPAMTGQG